MKKLLVLLAAILSISTIVTAQIAPNLASAKTFGLLSGGSISSLDTTIVWGNAGASTSVSSFVKANTVYVGGATVTTALSNLATAKSFCTAQSGTSISGTLAGQSLTPGVYAITGNATLSGALTLAGDTNAIYIFNISGGLIIDSAIYYGINNLMPSKIFWNISGTTQLHSYNAIYGIVMSGGAITLNPFTRGSMALLSQNSIAIYNDSTTVLRSFLHGTTVYSQNEIFKGFSLKAVGTCTSPLDNCNMVINPSFEELELALGGGGVLECPQQTGAIHMACDWDSYYWLPVWPYTTNPTLFSDCDDYTYPTDGDVGVPFNIYTYSVLGQPAHNGGHNYAGIQHSWLSTVDPQDDIPPFDTFVTWEDDEKLEKYLPAPLVPNKVYYMEFYSTLADKSNTAEILGVYPATSQFFAGYPIPPLYYTDPPFYTTGAYVTNNINWNKYAGCVSTTRSNIDVISIKRSSGSISVTAADPTYYTPWTNYGYHTMSYYYIDDIALRPLADAGADYTYNCAGSNYIGVNCAAIVGATYSWAPVGAFTAANAVIINPTSSYSEISCTAAGTYTFEVTVTYGTCSSTDQIVVTNPSSACTGVIYGPITYSSGSTTISAATVAIAGDIVVQGFLTYLTITSPNVSFFINKTITVRNGAHLVIDGAWLHGCGPCGNMWGGINVEKGGYLVIKNGSLIEDATTAVTTLTSGAGTIPDYQISQTIFNKNTNDIHVQANTSNMSANTIKNTIFVCRTLPVPIAGSFIANFNTIKAALTTNTVASLAPYPTGITRAGLRTSKGIEFTNLSNVTATVKVGSGAGGTADMNFFDNLDYGIHVTGTYLDVKNNRFQNMGGFQPAVPHGSPPLPPTGVAIYAPEQPIVNWNLMFIGNSIVPADRNYFYDCFRAVEISNYWQTLINYNTFSIATTPVATPVAANYVSENGIYLKDIKEVIEIRNNNMTNWRMAVWINRNTVTGGILNPIMDINTNNINANASGFCNQAILVSDIVANTITTVFPFYIRNNTITDVKNGIKISNFKNNMVIYNNPTISLRYSSSGIVAGIWLDACDKTEIKNNSVFSLRGAYGSADNWDLRGIYVKTSTNNKIFCNVLYSLGQCMVYEGGCLSTTNSSYSGTTNGILGNSMDNARTGLMLRTSGVIGQQGTSTFPSSNTWNNAYTFPNGRTYTYNTSLAFNANVVSKLYCLNLPAHFPPTTPTNTNMTNVTGYQYSITTPVGLNVASGAIVACPSIYVPAGMIASSGGLKSMDADEVAYSEELKQLLNSYTASGSSFVASEWMMQQFIYNELKEHTGLLADSLLNVFYTANENTAFGLFNNFDAAIQNQDYVQATAYNNSVVPANIIEQNQQTFNAIYLTHNDSTAIYSAEDSTNLNAIAVQCPLEGGNAVVQSRNLLMSIQNKMIEFTDVCDISVPESRQMLFVLDDHNMRLFPNPNNGSMTLECNLQPNESGVLNIFDITGKLIRTYKLASETKTQLIDGQILKAGVYLYEISVNGKKIKTDKLTIIK